LNDTVANTGRSRDVYPNQFEANGFSDLAKVLVGWYQYTLQDAIADYD
jgi:hypothetical protein